MNMSPAILLAPRVGSRDIGSRLNWAPFSVYRSRTSIWDSRRSSYILLVNIQAENQRSTDPAFPSQPCSGHSFTEGSCHCTSHHIQSQPTRWIEQKDVYSYSVACSFFSDTYSRHTQWSLFCWGHSRCLSSYSQVQSRARDTYQVLLQRRSYRCAMLHQNVL